MRVLEEARIDAVLMEYKAEGMDVEALALNIKQRFPDVPIVLLSAYPQMPEPVLWLVDEYVMRSEFPGGLKRILDRAIHRPWPARASTEPSRCHAIAA